MDAECRTAVLAYGFRHPLTLAVLHYETAPRPEVAEEPMHAADGVRPFEHVAGGKRYQIVPRFRWDESARVMSTEMVYCTSGSAPGPN